MRELFLFNYKLLSRIGRKVLIHPSMRFNDWTVANKAGIHSRRAL